MRSRVTLRLVASIEFRAMDLFFIANYSLVKHGKESLERSRIRGQRKKEKKKIKKKREAKFHDTTKVDFRLCIEYREAKDRVRTSEERCREEGGRMKEARGPRANAIQRETESSCEKKIQ